MDLRKRIDESKFMPIQFDTEWGKRKVTSALELIQFAHDQLQFYMKNKRSPNEGHTRRDLFAYSEILAAKSERIARFYLLSRGIFKSQGAPKSASEVVSYLKENGYWEAYG